MNQLERAYFEIPKRKRKDDPPITLFMASIASKDKMPIHCLFCKLQVFATRNRIVYAVDNEGYYDGKQSSSQQMCKRCGQHYHLVV